MDIFRLMAPELQQQALNYTLLSIIIALVAAAGLVVLAIVLIPKMSRHINVVKKQRTGDERFVDCKYRGKDVVHTLRCESGMVYDKLRVGGDYVVKIKKDTITELCKTGEKKWNTGKH